jgi:D-3-phosphoglycerate dehydrogenase / 2-oxoglutarate reductase
MPDRPLAVFAVTHPWLQAVLREQAPTDIQVRFLDTKDEAEVQSVLPLADALMSLRVKAEWVPLLSRCRLVMLPGVGYDGVDVPALARAGIPVALTPEGTTVGVAEHTLLLILALSKQLVQVHESMRRGEFDEIRWRAGSHFLYGRILGIVGFGRIGRRVASLAHAFEARILYSDVERASADVEQRLGVSHVPFDTLLEQADIVSVHTPLTPDTRGLFGAAQFARMKAGALFINTSRGDTYDMDALYASLRDGHLGGAGLDVFNPEPPPPDHPILQLSHVIATPHMATGTVEAHIEKAQAQYENIRRVLRGEPPRNQVAVG